METRRGPMEKKKMATKIVYDARKMIHGETKELTLSQKSTVDVVNEPDDVEDDEQPLSPTLQANGTNTHSIASQVALGLSRSRSSGGLSPSPPPPADSTARLDAIAKERDTLRQEVLELRKSLDSIEGKHQEEISGLQGELDEANEGKEHFETQYRKLLGRVNTIKSSLGDRLKADTVGTMEQNSSLVLFYTDTCTGEAGRSSNPYLRVGRAKPGASTAQYYAN